MRAHRAKRWWASVVAVAGLVVVLGSRAAAAGPCPDSMRAVLVPAGPFWMGSDARERAVAERLSSAATRAAGWFSAELPRHQASTEAFCIDRTLVTQARYAEFAQAAGHRPPGITREEYRRQGFLVHDYDAEVTAYLWHRGRPPAGKAEHPVVLVSAADGDAYCRWAAPDARLPTEAEWEKAARGPDGHLFPWGDTWDATRANSAERGPGGTSRVGQYVAGVSPYGLRDAVGNVFQWTSTLMPDGRRVVKGCAWDDDAGLCRPAFRHGRPPESRHILIGFRCAEPAAQR